MFSTLFLITTSSKSNMWKGDLTQPLLTGVAYFNFQQCGYGQAVVQFNWLLTKFMENESEKTFSGYLTDPGTDIYGFFPFPFRIWNIY